MLKRIAAAGLWFYCAWCAWSWIAALTGLPDAIGPVAAVAVAALVTADPMGWFWARHDSRQLEPQAASPMRSIPATAEQAA